MTLTRLFSGAMLALLAALPAVAQEGMTRTILNRGDLDGAAGMEVISSILEVQPGATVPRHFHNGIETGSVLEGALIQLPGKPPQMMAAGTPVWNLRGVVHGGFKVVGDKPLKLYTVHIVDKGKPLFDGLDQAALRQ
jgi:quercetin dioxygenase-like cupin family protein